MSADATIANHSRQCVQSPRGARGGGAAGSKKIATQWRCCRKREPPRCKRAGLSIFIGEWVHMVPFMARTFALSKRSAARWRGNEELNPEQLAVATADDRAMLVVAGAGSGKTRALTWRLAWLVHQGVDPRRILLMTFTNRAAREMIDRAERIVDTAAHMVTGGTFHHVANRLLREHGKHIGLAESFTILDREDSRDLMGRCAAELIPDGGRKRRFPQKNVLCAIAGYVANTLQELDDVLLMRFAQFSDLGDEIGRVLARYAELKRERQLCDYDDLLSLLLQLLREHPSVRERIASNYDHILVDEYQDTNAVQGAILDFLLGDHGNICVVGDDAQSIYSFRGACFANMMDFCERYEDAALYRLETNYRSVPEILSLANASIEHNSERLPKTLRAHKEAGARPVVVPCADASTQARFVADYILHLLDEGRRLRDIAVLYRNHWHSMEIQLELQRADLPFQVRGGLRFFEQAHIKDVVAHLRLAANPHDELAWYRLLPQLPRIGQVGTRKLWQALQPHEDPFDHFDDAEIRALVPAAAHDAWDAFTGVLKAVRGCGVPAEGIAVVMEGPYGGYLETRYENAAGREEDLRSLADFANAYDEVPSFLSELALAGEISGETVVSGDEADDQLICSTIHQAKGLEWPIVLVPWLADGRFPSEQSLDDTASIEEERRVFHVAVTRAEEELYLLVPQQYRPRGGGLVFMKPSRFLSELDRELFETLELE